MNVLNTNDPPVAEDLHITVYSGRTTNFSLPAYDPDGNPVELYIITEPQSGSGTIKMSSENVVSIGGLRRKVRSPAQQMTPHQTTFVIGLFQSMKKMVTCLALLVLQGLNPVSFYAPDEVIPDYGVTFRYVNNSGLRYVLILCLHFPL